MAGIDPSKGSNKVTELCTRLSELALEKGPNARLPSVRELCQLYETSWRTLSDALDILEEQQLIYRKAGSGIFVAAHTPQKSICLLLNASWHIRPGASPFWGNLWGHISQQVQRHRHEMQRECHTFLFVQPEDGSPELPGDFLRLLEAGRVSGVIAIGTHFDVVHWLTKQQIPCVTFAGWGPYHVGLDNVELLRMGIECLARQGCHRIGFWVDLPEEGNGREAILAHLEQQGKFEHYFRYFLNAYGLPFDPDLVRCCEVPPGHSVKELTLQDQGYLLAKQAFSDPAQLPPDGIFISNDLMTEGALMGLAASGIQPGKDIKIVTHANSDTMLLFDYFDGLTAIEYDTAELAEKLFSMLVQVLSGHTPAQPIIQLAPRIRTKRHRFDPAPI